MNNVKNALSVGIICISISLLISCGGGGGSGYEIAVSDDSGDEIAVSDDSGIGDVNGSEVTIKGSFTGGIQAKNNLFNPIFNLFTKDAMALDANYVSKVLIFTAGTYQYQSVDVIDGSFAINIPRDSNPIGMIFAGINNEYLGYLYLGENIASLPISRVESDVATIDLGELSSSGMVVEPSNNPFGYEIPMTEDELRSFGQSNGLFAELIRNPDVDGNGVIDCLENKRNFMELHYGVVGGYFDNSLTPIISTHLQQYNLAFVTNKDICPDSLSLEGPEGSRMFPPISINRFDSGGSYCVHATYFPFERSMEFEVPAAGEYIITGNQDDVLKFRIPDQTPILDNIITIVPTFILDQDGYIQEINWVYCLADGSGQSINPESITTKIQINVYGKNNGELLYNTSMLDSSSTTKIDLSDRNILWNDVAFVGTNYTDVFGNAYGITWMQCDYDSYYCNK